MHATVSHLYFMSRLHDVVEGQKTAKLSCPEHDWVYEWFEILQTSHPQPREEDHGAIRLYSTKESDHIVFPRRVLANGELYVPAPRRGAIITGEEDAGAGDEDAAGDNQEEPICCNKVKAFPRQRPHEQESGGREGGRRGGGEEGRGEGYSHESWSLSMGRVSLCYSTEPTPEVDDDSNYYTPGDPVPVPRGSPGSPQAGVVAPTRLYRGPMYPPKDSVDKPIAKATCSGGAATYFRESKERILIIWNGLIDKQRAICSRAACWEAAQQGDEACSCATDERDLISAFQQFYRFKSGGLDPGEASSHRATRRGGRRHKGAKYHRGERVKAAIVMYCKNIPYQNYLDNSCNCLTGCSTP